MFDEGFVVEEEEGLEGSVGAFEVDGAGVAAIGVEEGHEGWFDGSAPEGVEGAAVEFVAGVAFVDDAAFDDFFPEPGGLVGLDGWAADLLDEESAGGEGLVADDGGGEPVARGPGEEAVVGVVFEVARADFGGLAVGGGEEDLFLEGLEVPTVFH